MDGLKPCPFCGGEAHTYKNNLWHVACERAHNGCVTMSAFVTEAEAIAAWNTPWNTRSERTCRNTDDDCDAWFKCSECGLHSKLEIMSGGYDIPNFCPSCGAKVVSE